MKRCHRVRVAVLFAITASPCFAQTWTYQGTQVCYGSGTTTPMCYAQGSITGYLQSQSANPQNFATQPNAAGAAIGSLVGKLAATWLEHHRRVKAEQKALREELLAYIDADRDVLTEALNLNRDTADQIVLLKAIDEADLAIWDGCEKGIRGTIGANEKLLETTAKRREIAGKLKGKDLDWALNDPNGAKASYQRSLDLGKQVFVYNQLYRALVGYFQYQLKNPGTAVPPKETS